MLFTTMTTYAGKYGCSATDGFSSADATAKLEICRTDCDSVATIEMMKGLGIGVGATLFIEVIVVVVYKNW